VKLSREEFRLAEEGARWCIRRGFGWEEDLERTEASGRIEGADPSDISEKAIDRGLVQIGTPAPATTSSRSRSRGHRTSPIPKLRDG
jgi:tRNA-splicing ligase RtcB